MLEMDCLQDQLPFCVSYQHIIKTQKYIEAEKGHSISGQPELIIDHQALNQVPCRLVG
jgi:hypothetical protein